VKRTAIAIALLLAACSGGTADADSDEGPKLESTPPSSTATTATDSTEQGVETTTSTTVVTGNARFVIGNVVFGDLGSIEVGNLGPDAGDLTGHWLAVDPFYLELPSTVLAAGKSLVVSVDVDADPDLVVTAAGLLPPLSAGSGEVGLYTSGDFGDPSAMIDYVAWGSTDHERFPVAVAAGLWPEDEAIVTDGAATGLAIVDRSEPGPQGWAPTTG
jgi:hypothetical protein